MKRCNGLDGQLVSRSRIRHPMLTAAAVAALGLMVGNAWAQPAVATATAPASQPSSQPSGPSVDLSALRLELVDQEYGQPGRNRAVEDTPLAIAGKQYASGFGTHASSRLDIDVRGATRFVALVGVDDAAEAELAADGGEGGASVEFIVIGDGKELFRSGVMEKGNAAKPINVALTGVKRLSLRVTDGEDGINYDHGNWVDARFEYAGEAPVAIDPRAPTSQPQATQPAVAPAAKVEAGSVWLGQLDLALAQPEWGSPANRSGQSTPMQIGGKPFERGLGTHAGARLDLDVKGATRFVATVGVDDNAERGRPADNNERASVEFVVYGDEQVLFKSGVMRLGDAAKPIDVPLAGVKRLSLRVTNGGDPGINFDRGAWADAKLEYLGTPPATVAIAGSATNAVVLTPKPAPTPRVNGARTFGARPGSPVLIKIPATGTKPITFAVDKLPAGLTLDAAGGVISGVVEAEGDYAFTVTATNTLGAAKREWKLLIDDAPGTLSRTPPMGWNSWNVWGMAIDDAKVRAAADSFVSSGLIDHGWTYINIDDGWQNRSPRDREADFAGQTRDRDGRIILNRKFPDMKALTDYVHSKGLKMGIYSSPGTKTCGGVEGSFGYEAEDARQYAAWGIDYLKYDWCSYTDYANLIRRRDRTTLDERQLNMAPYVMMRDELRKQKRDIIYSLCQYGWNNVWEWGASVDGQLWRTTGDIVDTWQSMANIGFGQAGKEKFAKPGNWNDPDMLVVGHVGWGPNVRPSRLTPDEQYTHVSLWALLSSPLLIGCDLTRLDEFTMGLLTNDEVIEVNQDPLGKQAARIRDDGDQEIWAKQLEDGTAAVGLFNRSDAATSIEVKWSELPLAESHPASLDVRDVWRQASLGAFEGSYKVEVPPHGVRLIRVGAKKD